MSTTFAEETVTRIFCQPQSQINSRLKREAEAAEAHLRTVQEQSAINERFSSLAKRFPNLKFLQGYPVR